MLWQTKKRTLQQMLDQLVERGVKYGMEINEDKLKVMSISEREETRG